jgi:predicted Zn-dependent protease
MGEYDAVWVFLISAIFVGFYIFIEARPKGSTFTKNIFSSVSRFFRKR